MPKKREWLITAREKKKLSRKQLAEKVEVDYTYIYRIEKGEKTPSPIVAKRIGELLKIDWVLFY